MAVYFDAEILKFFKELSKNNNREWFNENKQRFKEKVEQPFTRLITDLIEEMKGLNPKIQITPKESIFRIYKDIRFSKDKTPYKEHISALVSEGGRKDYLSPGLYIEIGAKDIAVYSGVYMPSTKELMAIRFYIAGHLKEFEKAINDKSFVKRFGSVQGEKNKVIPADLKEAALQQQLIYNKNFYYKSSLSPQWLSSPKLLKELVKSYLDASSVNVFLQKALKS